MSCMSTREQHEQRGVVCYPQEVLVVATGSTSTPLPRVELSCLCKRQPASRLVHRRRQVGAKRTGAGSYTPSAQQQAAVPLEHRRRHLCAYCICQTPVCLLRMPGTCVPTAYARHLCAYCVCQAAVCLLHMPGTCVPTAYARHLCAYCICQAPVCLLHMPGTCVPTAYARHLCAYCICKAPVCLLRMPGTCVPTAYARHLCAYCICQAPVCLCVSAKKWSKVGLSARKQVSTQAISHRQQQPEPTALHAQLQVSCMLACTQLQAGTHRRKRHAASDRA